MAQPQAISAQDARQILSVLLNEGKVSRQQAKSALARYRKRVSELRSQLAILEGKDGSFPPGRPTERRAARRARRKQVSPKRLKAMRQQGAYLAAVRPLKPADRAKIKAVRQEKGFSAAVAEARRLGKG